MDFWEKNKFKKIGTCQDMNGAKSFEWTRDSRHFITAVLRPKRRVDNGFKIWTYYGEMVYEKKIDQLYQVAIRPAPASDYPDRKMSPRLTDKRLKKSMAAAQEASKPKSYIPPHLRGKANAAPSSIMKRETSGPRKLTQLESAAAKAGSKAAGEAALKEQKAEKNRKRRERQKAAKEKEAREKLEAAQAVKDAAEKVRQDKLDSMTDEEKVAKDIKKLQKKLKQVKKIEDLKAKGTELDKAQEDKLATKVDLVAALAKLGVN
jgi:translation initiation factor 2A